MKITRLLLFVLVCSASSLFGQAPQAINYQGIARDPAGTPLINQVIGLQLTVHTTSASGPTVYQETFTPTTNQFGLYTVQIGRGTPVTGTFSAISWGTVSHFLEVAMDPTGGNAYVAAGTSELVSVPYALYAETSGTGGPTGATGPSGDPGVAGPMGATGAAGTNGATGATGPSGDPGVAGPQGIQGVAGPQGIQGVTGAQGVAGIQGVAGPAGANGTNGTNGLNGATGATGVAGPQGLQGVAGPQGLQGVTGAAGTNGINGTNGTNGINGATGATGVAGANGATGVTGSVGATGATGNSGGIATYRWATFHTYEQSTGWTCGNDPLMFGGVAPQVWTDASGLASQMSPNKDVQRTLFQNKGYAKENAMICSDAFASYSSTDGQVFTVLFRISNTSGSPITWTPSFYYTAYSLWGEMASITCNGVNTWSSGATGSAAVPISIPSGQVSTVIFVSTSGLPNGAAPQMRSCRLVFYNNSLTLPLGLSFVDDLDTATGGWAN